MQHIIELEGSYDSKRSQSVFQTTRSSQQSDQSIFIYRKSGAYRKQFF